MKKNTMMRIACFLLVAVLLSTSVISGTYAKYTTAADGSDTATVAKWGVEITGIEETLFASEYGTTVAALNNDTVAPGTANEDGVTFSLTGTPEVAVEVKVTVTGSNGTGEPTDIVLAASTYDDPTGKIDGGKFTLDAPYNPVVFTLKDGNTELIKGTLAEIEAFLEDTDVNKQYDPNKDLSKIFGGSSGTYTLTWEWVIGTDDTINAADTYLGNQDPLQTIDFAINIDVTQVD